MKVSAADITVQLDRLLDGSLSREAVETWAEERQRAFDEGRLTIDPVTDEARVWSGITYLLGVGLQAAPGQYLHSPKDFLEFRRRAKL